MERGPRSDAEKTTVPSKTTEGDRRIESARPSERRTAPDGTSGAEIKYTLDCESRIVGP
jgi:hypothetical protein